MCFTPREVKRFMRKFLQELDVLFEATQIKGARRVRTLPTLLETTALKWYLVRRDKTPRGLDNAKSWEEVKKMLLTRFVPRHQHFVDDIAMVTLKQGYGK